MTPDFTIIRRFVAWFSIAVLGVASWLPAEEMIRTGADGRLEHAAAYLISELAVFTAYPRSSLRSDRPLAADHSTTRQKQRMRLI